MPQKPRFSVILCFRNGHDVIETSLAALYGLQDLPFELFLIDDGSTDNSREIIHSLLEYHRHDHTYYFEYPSAGGRGLRLNEAITQCNTPLVWAPESIGRLSEGGLADAVSAAEEREAAFIHSVPGLPENPQEWVDWLDRERWPQDGAFLWNFSRIDPAHRWFCPSTRFPGVELALRIGEEHTGEKTARFSEPVRSDDLPGPASSDRRELIFTFLRRPGTDGDRYGELLERLGGLSPEDGSNRERLLEAEELKADGRYNEALDRVDEVLKNDPGQSDAKALKLEILEKKRRFVEVSELKHELESDRKGGKTAVESIPDRPREKGEIRTSIIIPTTAHGKRALEHCLLHLAEHHDSDTTELIVIDNASLDDTHDYLAELQEKGFLHCRVITNRQNVGFAASVNQGLQKAEGDYACVLHNDVELNGDLISDLEAYMDDHPRYGIIGPLADKTLNPEQAVSSHSESEQGLQQTDYLDSFCMMIRTGIGLEMDEKFELAFFDDIDLCFQARKAGYRVGIATDLQVTHYLGTTTFALDLDIDSRQYWKNIAWFNEKWEIEVWSEEELKAKSRFDQLLELDELVNPVYPEPALKAWYLNLFTDELRTEILKSDHDPETLCRLVHLFMVMDEREVLRRLEDRLDNVELPARLIYHLVRYYFDKNIYSRCLHYLDRLPPAKQSLQSELYRLAISVEEKEMEVAVPRLTDLLERAPSNPWLYRLAGEIHQFNGDSEEARSFFRIASQIDPYQFSVADPQN